MCDWASIEHEYVTSDISYRKLHKKYADDPEVTRAKIEKYGKEGNWSDKREAYRNAVKAESVQKAVTATSDALARLSACVYEAAADLAEKLMVEIKRKDTLKSYEYKNYSGTLTDLAKLLPEGIAATEDRNQSCVAMLPERTEIDDVDATT